MSNLQNANEITRGAMAVIISQVLPQNEEGLTVAQAAQMLGISVSNLNLMRRTGTGPQSYREGDKIFYKPSSIKAFVEAKNRRAA